MPLVEQAPAQPLVNQAPAQPLVDQAPAQPLEQAPAQPAESLAPCGRLETPGLRPVPARPVRYRRPVAAPCVGPAAAASPTARQPARRAAPARAAQLTPRPDPSSLTTFVAAYAPCGRILRPLARSHARTHAP